MLLDSEDLVHNSSNHTRTENGSVGSHVNRLPPGLEGYSNGYSRGQTDGGLYTEGYRGQTHSQTQSTGRMSGGDKRSITSDVAVNYSYPNTNNSTRTRGDQQHQSQRRGGGNQNHSNSNPNSPIAGGNSKTSQNSHSLPNTSGSVVLPRGDDEIQRAISSAS